MTNMFHLYHFTIVSLSLMAPPVHMTTHNSITCLLAVISLLLLELEELLLCDCYTPTRLDGITPIVEDWHACMTLVKVVIVL